MHQDLDFHPGAMQQPTPRSRGCLVQVCQHSGRRSRGGAPQPAQARHAMTIGLRRQNNTLPGKDSPRGFVPGLSTAALFTTSYSTSWYGYCNRLSSTGNISAKAQALTTTLYGALRSKRCASSKVPGVAWPDLHHAARPFAACCVSSGHFS